MKTTKLQLVLLEWWDHCSFTNADWRSAEATAELRPCKIKTVGWVIDDGLEYITVVSTIDITDGKFAMMCKGDFCILKQQIIKIHKLKDSFNAVQKGRK